MNARDLDRLAEALAGLGDDAVDEAAAHAASDLSDAECQSWFARALPGQYPPEGDWAVWLLMAGRGFGKTRAGAEWVRMRAMANAGMRIALVGATLDDARAVMVEGESGLLRIARGEDAMTWQPGAHRLVWNNGSEARLYSAEAPEKLRGPQHHIAWCDELAKWPNAARAWDNLQLGLRLGRNARTVVTTTPRPMELLRRLIGAPGTVVTRGSTYDNLHLAADFIERVEELYGGTRLGRQELEGELIADLEGALWRRELIEGCRAAAPAEFIRVVIGVDPAASTGGDACGIVAVGKDAGGTAWVLGDHSVSGRSPQGWAHAVASAADRWGADRVIAEKNSGGDMVESTLRAADVTMPVKLVSASRGKIARAEPVVALYEQGKAKHAGAFSELEDEMCGMCSDGTYAGPGRSPDRADALVWAMSELMLGKARAVEPRVRVF